MFVLDAGLAFGLFATVRKHNRCLNTLVWRLPIFAWVVFAVAVIFGELVLPDKNWYKGHAFETYGLAIIIMWFLFAILGILGFLGALISVKRNLAKRLVLFRITCLFFFKMMIVDVSLVARYLELVESVFTNEPLKGLNTWLSFILPLRGVVDGIAFAGTILVASPRRYHDSSHVREMLLLRLDILTQPSDEEHGLSFCRCFTGETTGASSGELRGWTASQSYGLNTRRDSYFEQEQEHARRTTLDINNYLLHELIAQHTAELLAIVVQVTDEIQAGITAEIAIQAARPRFEDRRKILQESITIRGQSRAGATGVHKLLQDADKNHCTTLTSLIEPLLERCSCVASIAAVKADALASWENHQTKLESIAEEKVVSMENLVTYGENLMELQVEEDALADSAVQLAHSTSESLDLKRMAVAAIKRAVQVSAATGAPVTANSLKPSWRSFLNNLVKPGDGIQLPDDLVLEAMSVCSNLPEAMSSASWLPQH